jgi:hypothetical protein
MVYINHACIFCVTATLGSQTLGLVLGVQTICGMLWNFSTESLRRLDYELIRSTETERREFISEFGCSEKLFTALVSLYELVTSWGNSRLNFDNVVRAGLTRRDDRRRRLVENAELSCMGRYGFSSCLKKKIIREAKLIGDS